MKYNYKKITKNITEEDITPSVTIKSLEYTPFNELIDPLFSTSKSKLNQEINAYYEYKRQKSLEPLREKYIKLLNTKITDKYTIQKKEENILEFETKNPEVLNSSLVPLKKDARLTKRLQRLSINNEVRDYGDSIADLAKWNSLLTSTVMAMYGTMTDTNKAKLPQEQRGLIEEIFGLFKGTETVADYNLKSGTSFIKDILNKEAKIKKIVKGE